MSRHIVAAPLATLILLAAATPAVAAPACAKADAGRQLTSLYQDALQHFEAASEEPTLEKEKVGHVLVARPSNAGLPLVDPDEQAKLMAEINRAGSMLRSKPAAVCGEAERIRRKYGL